jgi:hypothetical protein
MSSTGDNHTLPEFDLHPNVPDGGVGFAAVAYHPDRDVLADDLRDVFKRCKYTTGGPSDVDSIPGGIRSGDLPVNVTAPSESGRSIAGVGTERGDWIDDVVDHVAGTPSVTDVVVNNLAALGETHAEIHDRLGTLLDADVRVHALADSHLASGIVIDEDSADVALRLLDELADVAPELQREAARRDARQYIESRDPSVGGRPPLGFAFDDGDLVPADNFEQVRELLLRVDADDLPKRAAARKLDTSPRTITRCLEEEERREMYSI